MISKKMLLDITKIDQDAKLDLYEIDLTKIVGSKTIFRVHNGLNELRKPVTWQGNIYEPYLINAEGFERTGQGISNRPTLNVGNLMGCISRFLQDFDGLLGATVTRHEVLAKYLDAVNFKNGNKHADPCSEIVSTYVVERVSQRNAVIVTFELALPCETDGALIPARVIIANTCGWIYRSSECSYTGVPVADEFNQPTNDITRDRCSRCLTGCKIRFGQHGVLPFGGFPTAAKLS